MKINLNFIPLNTVPKGVKSLAVYNENNKKVGVIPLGNLAPKSTGNILYTFGALSDVHLPVDTGPDDFVRALNYLNNEEKVDFICISGDMGSSGTDAEWASYKNYVDTYSPNTPVHISAGNHDAGHSAPKAYEYPIQYTGNPLYYSFTQGDDVFIIFGMSLWGDPPFTNESLQWLYETLEVNRNKRCFVFEHFMRYNGCGNANGTYYADNLNNTNGKVFLSLMKHYKNVLWFHGHSHTKFNVQEVMPSPIANYDRMFGCHSIHIPGLCYPRDKDMNSFYAESEGYVVDVYKNGIHLRGRDFVAKKFLPIASYWIDTTPTAITAKSYTDSTGIINTGSSTPSEPSGEITVVDNSKIELNGRYSQSSGKLVETGGVLGINIDVKPNTTYKLKYTGSITDITVNYDRLLLLNAEGTTSTVNGSVTISTMTQGTVYNSDNTGVEVTFTTYADTTNIWFNILFKEIGQYIMSVDEIANVVCTIQEIDLPPIVPVNLLDTQEVFLNKRWSKSSGGATSYTGGLFLYVPIETDGNTVHTLKFKNTISDLLSHAYNTIYPLDENKNIVGDGTLNDGRNAIPNFATGILKIDDANCQFDFTAPIETKYLAVSVVVDEGITITKDTIKDFIITLDEFKTYNDTLLNGETNLLETQEIYLNQRFKSSGSIAADDGVFTLYIPVEAGTHTLKIRNIRRDMFVTTGLCYKNSIYALDTNKSNPQTVNGSPAFHNMTTGVTSLNGGREVQVEFTTYSNTKYIALSVLATSAISITSKDIENYIITLESEGIDVMKEGEKYLNQRYSKSGGGFVDAPGVLGLMIPFKNDNNNPMILTFDNLTHDMLGTNCLIYILDNNKSNPLTVNGDCDFVKMTSGVEVADDHLSGTVTFTPPINEGYLVTCIRSKNDGTPATMDEFENYIITLD